MTSNNDLDNSLLQILQDLRLDDNVNLDGATLLYKEEYYPYIEKIKAAVANHCDICENRWMQCKCGEEGRRVKRLTGAEWLERFKDEMFKQTADQHYFFNTETLEHVFDAAHKASGVKEE